ncbi:DUF928 domain-containing protein [Coleofasciculus sp. E2-BRE-01]|uniref:DUF928 domain-containing protein n=1 Tax=Coleofasciculus sp. E2-BRE-01 TaxID=3069524 RepID=UPI0033053ABB
MTWQHYYIYISFFVISLVGNILPIEGLPVQAQEVTPGRTLASRSMVTVSFTPPPTGDPPLPNNTEGGGTRDGGCPQDAKALEPTITPVMPATRQGLTVAERPTFFVYVPKTTAKQALFVLKDENEDYYYETTLPMPKQAGIISVKLPDEASKLEMGKTYHWSFLMICGAQVTPDSPGVQGVIKRIKPDGTLNQLDGEPLLEQALQYGANGIWFDTLTTLAQLRQSNPQDSSFQVAWADLLKSVGLDAIATQPLVN